MAQVEIKLNDKPWRDKLAQVGNRPRMMRFLKVLAQLVAFKEVIQHFKQQKGPEGSWPQRSESTERRYREIYEGKRVPPPGYQRGMFKPGGALLVLSGQLSRAFSLSNIRGDQDSVTIFNPTEYAAQHDEGGDPLGLGRAGNVPQRKFMWISQSGVGLMAKGLAEKMASEEA